MADLLFELLYKVEIKNSEFSIAMRFFVSESVRLRKLLQYCILSFETMQLWQGKLFITLYVTLNVSSASRMIDMYELRMIWNWNEWPSDG